MKKFIFHICILYIIFYKLALPKCTSTVTISTSTTFSSQGHKENNPVDWKVKTEKWKTQLKIAKTPIFSYGLDVLEIFNFIFHFPVLFLCTHHYSKFTLTLLVILRAIGNIRHIFRRIINRLPKKVRDFFEEI